MNVSLFPLDKFIQIETPFYYYDIALLENTLTTLSTITKKYNTHVHYAIKANANPKIISIISKYGFGADCVSKGEIELALKCGIKPEQIVFAGVCKKDKEIKFAISNKIFCFNVESLQELEVINKIAGEMNTRTNIAFRINPNVLAHTHKNITTGIHENKFGINIDEFYSIIDDFKTKFVNVDFIGLHFHIGSQILDMNDFLPLCNVINTMLSTLQKKDMNISYVNVGGGLGVDYLFPDKNPISDFEGYMNIYKNNIQLQSHQTLHFELGRSIVAQMGSLISQVIYVKQGMTTKFLIVDAGMTELIRPALYQANHYIQNISNKQDNNTDATEKFDVVGPICESTDVFGKDVALPANTQRGDYIAIRSAGAYGESMASTYNGRDLVKAYLSSEI